MRATARAQPNIALIKYWGKRDRVNNLPAVGSISVTLADLYTEMCVSLDETLASDRLVVNELENAAMLPRISACLDNVVGRSRRYAQIDSRCNFPVAAGLASSASSFAATVVAASAASGSTSSTAELASLAGRSSGSAARSLYGGFVELRNTPGDVSVETILDGDQWPLKVIIAVTSEGPKPVNSGEAMEISRKTSPFYSSWLENQSDDLDVARAAIREQDFEKLAGVCEHNCLKMHSVMWASRPAIVYWNSATLNCMQTVRDLRSTGSAVFFTIDAGPQLKAICLESDEQRVREALSATTGVVDVLSSGLGDGARLLESA
ncbi:MAG: diphosphomevalonate decarboxylase [Gammaproteobacteria bacterium]|nr:MAG: diphosphomevalonate decarboxylase [Gammaproteobacteria bacterium]